MPMLRGLQEVWVHSSWSSLSLAYFCGHAIYKITHLIACKTHAGDVASSATEQLLSQNSALQSDILIKCVCVCHIRWPGCLRGGVSCKRLPSGSCPNNPFTCARTLPCEGCALPSCSSSSACGTPRACLQMQLYSLGVTCARQGCSRQESAFSVAFFIGVGRTGVCKIQTRALDQQ